MPDQPPTKRGGSHTARALGLVGVVVHLDPADHALLQRAARLAGKTLKEFCRLAALQAASRLDSPPAPE